MNPLICAAVLSGFIAAVCGLLLIEPIGQSITHYAIGCGRC